ncbi:TPA: hypothetical protein PXP39_001307 [Yersinia enterocolitica]|nr:hypothetical protein [Yersinia enterocolitica]HDL7831455.1 hypothetical protein [Yersinia enterocolitica]HDL7873919.1 hypothetical protein [Yersinia enterocolitica]HDL7885828.1 hypothetical protein [Yersinia enterocolitica]HDL7894760.1 hypothetical protein [Yersinia enterocolitica]
MFLNNTVVQRAVSSLELDPENPRLIGFIEDSSLKNQKDILLTLTINYDVIDICNSIMTNGYYPEFNIVTIPKGNDDRKLLVIEGNRRTSACKIILNPEILKGTKYNYMINKIKRNASYDKICESIKKINVVVLDNRADAETYKALKHTRQSIKPWSPYTQGGYFVSKLSVGMTLSDLREELNLTEMKLNQIQRVVFFYRLGSVILNLTCWTDAERDYLKSQKDELKIEAIIRLIQYSEFISNIGTIKIDEFGNLITSQISISQFYYILEILARDSHFIEDKGKNDFILSTRQENKEEIKAYINELKLKLDLVKEEYIDHISVPEDPTINEPEVASTPEDDETLGPIKRKGKKWIRLLPLGTIHPSSCQKLESLVIEAVKLDIKKHPYCAALLARSIFEITLKVWIKRSGFEKDLTSEYKEKAFDFNSLLSFSNKNMASLITDDTDAVKAIRQVVNSLLTTHKEILNLTNHNDMSILSDSEVNHIKDKLSTFCTYFLPRLVV